MLSSSNSSVILMILDGLEHILRKAGGTTLDTVRKQIEDCGGLSKIEAFQHESVSSVSEKAHHIIESFFSPLNENDEETKTIILNESTPRPFDTFTLWAIETDLPLKRHEDDKDEEEIFEPIMLNSLAGDGLDVTGEGSIVK